MLHRKFIRSTAALALAGSISLAQAGAIDALKKFNADTDGLSGSFSQTVKSKKKSQTTHGSFQILRPGLFKWEYSRPYKQTIVGDGKTIWLYDVDLAQVTKSSQDQTIGDSPAAILSNKTALDSSYTLKEDGSAGGIDYVLASPKRNNAGYQYIRIGFKGDALAAMQLKDSFGNETGISFSNLNTKPDLARSVSIYTAQRRECIEQLSIYNKASKRPSEHSDGLFDVFAHSHKQPEWQPFYASSCAGISSSSAGKISTPPTAPATRRIS